MYNRVTAEQVDLAETSEADLCTLHFSYPIRMATYLEIFASNLDTFTGDLAAPLSITSSHELLVSYVRPCTLVYSGF